MDFKYRLAASAVFLGALVYLLGELDLRRVYEQLLLAKKEYLAAGLLLFTSMLYFKVQKLAWISRYYSHPIGFSQAALVQMVGIAFATLTPGRVGEGSKIVLLKKYLNIPVPTALNVVILERIMDVVFLSAGAFFLSAYMFKDMVVVSGFFFFLFIAFLYLFMKRQYLFVRLIPEKYKAYLAVERKSNRPLFMLISGATVVIWGADAVFQWLLLRAFDTQVSIFLVFGVFCISTIMVFFSVLPAGLGTVDASYLILYPLIGVPIEVAVSVLLIYRFLSTPMPFVASAIVLNYHHISPADIRKEIKGG